MSTSPLRSSPVRGSCLRMVGLALALGTSVAASGCGAPPEEGAPGASIDGEEGAPADDPAFEGGAQALGITPESIAMDALKSVGSSVLTWIINDITGHDPAGDIQRRFDAIDSKLKDIEQKVVDLTTITRQAEVSGVKRDIDRDRAEKIKTPLFQVRTYPERAAAYQDLALSAAFTYSASSFYWFTGPSTAQPTRFDHRMAAPTVIEAVDTWLVMRKLAGQGFDPGTRAQLRQFADELAGRVAHINQGVKCERREVPIYKKVPNEERRAVGCTISYPCVDRISERAYLAYPTVQRMTACRDARYPMVKESEELRAQYGGPDMMSIVEQWRQIANH